MTPDYLRHLSRNVARLVAPCHPWRGAHDALGYPRTTVKGKSVYVHRKLYAEVWQLAPGERVYRLCGNRSCINVHHMSTVKPGPKGRRRRPASVKLTPKKVRAIRERWAQPNRPTQQALADKFSVSRSCVSLLLRGLTWADV